MARSGRFLGQQVRVTTGGHNRSAAIDRLGEQAYVDQFMVCLTRNADHEVLTTCPAGSSPLPSRGSLRLRCLV